MEDIQAIDTMCRPTYVDPEAVKKQFTMHEIQVMVDTTFAGVKQRLDLEEGEEWKVLAMFGNESVEETVEEMDEVGVETMFIDQAMMWSHHDKELCMSASVERLTEYAEESDGRIVPGVCYDPFNIQESLERIEHAVTELGFKYVWFHPITFDLKPSDAKCYPLYSKCIELDVPVCFQTGQSAEILPSEPGHPMYADDVALDFPELTLVLTHTGWPWFDEWISMLWRHPNVYGNIGAYFPSFLPDRQVEFIDGRIRDKVMWATNGLGLERCKEEFLDLPLKDETKRAVLRENALEVFDL